MISPTMLPFAGVLRDVTLADKESATQRGVFPVTITPDLSTAKSSGTQNELSCSRDDYKLCVVIEGQV